MRQPEESPSRLEEEFYDAVGEQLLGQEHLTVEVPAAFLAGSMDAFNYMLERIGSVQEKRILDYGCGSGWLGVYLAKRGALVEGFDISGKLIDCLDRDRTSRNSIPQI